MAQIDKNNVPAENQLKVNEAVFFENRYGSGLKILFVGNSITLHGYKADIGWYGKDYGMAASEKNKDYVHIVMNEIRKKDSDAACCICQAAQWEVNYKNPESVFPLYEEARKFNADVIIMRIIENCKTQEFDSECFCNEYKKLIDYLIRKKMQKSFLQPVFGNIREMSALYVLLKKEDIR